jgi:hypothetical protein
MRLAGRRARACATVVARDLMPDLLDGRPVDLRARMQAAVTD